MQVRVLALSDDWYRPPDSTALRLALCALAGDFHLDFCYIHSDCSGEYLEFLDSLALGGPWDLVAVEHNSCWEMGYIFDKLLSYLKEGGRLVVVEFDVDGDQNAEGQFFPLWNAMGAGAPVESFESPGDLHIWAPGHPLVVYRGEDTLPEMLGGWQDLWGDDGDRLSFGPYGGEPVMGFSSLPAEGEAGAVVRAGDGWPCQSILISQLLSEDPLDRDGDGLRDGVELLRNAMWAVVWGCEGLGVKAGPRPSGEPRVFSPDGRLVLVGDDTSRLRRGVWVVVEPGKGPRLLVR